MLRPLTAPAFPRRYSQYPLKVCTEGEDAYHTRRPDVLTPIHDYADEAFDVLLPFYGIQNSGVWRYRAFE